MLPESLTREQFVQRYGGIYEHSAWVAESVFEQARDGGGAQVLAPLFAACVDRASREQKLALIRAHPDLAGKAAIAGQLSDESNQEQASAGINQCSAIDYERFQTLNRQYREKFSFPFVMAVRDSSRQQILAEFAKRLDNGLETEFLRAIGEIHKIARLRLEALDGE